MDNPIWGIVTLIFSSGAFGISYYAYRRDHYPAAILLLMMGGFILRLFTACDFFLHPWDEVYHAVVAKHLMAHPLTPTLYEHPLLPYDYRNWAGNHIWLHKQPLPLWSMALSMSLFGVNEIALRLPSILLTTMGIALTYYIGTYFFDRRTGYLAAFFYAINGLIIEMAAGRVATDHVDVFFLFFIELAIFFCILYVQRQRTIYNVAAGLCIGAAILCKWLPALIVLPIWLLLVLDSGRFSRKTIALQFLLLVGITAIVFLPWQFYIYAAFPAEAHWEGTYNARHLFEPIENHEQPFYYYIDQIRINYNELIYAVLIWFIIIFYRSPHRRRQAALALWIFVPLLFFSAVRTKMQGYLLFTSPALFVVTAAFFYWVCTIASQANLSQGKRIAARAFLALLLLLSARYCLERVKPFKHNRMREWVIDLKLFNDAVKPKSVLFNYPAPIEAMFYTNVTVYSSMPDSSELAGLANKGYHVYVNEPEGSTPLPQLNATIVHLANPNR